MKELAVTYELVTLCPKCEGKMKVKESRNGKRLINICPTCKGEGVLKEKKKVEIPQEFMFNSKLQ